MISIISSNKKQDKELELTPQQRQKQSEFSIKNIPK